jgi:threonyl-tRNA synthetase
MLTRIYGLAFETEEALNVYKVKTEEAKRRDHRVLNESHNYFLISEEIGKGLPIYLPEGAFLRKKLEDLMYQKEFKCGYQYIYSPLLTRKGLYQKSGHLDHYAEDMYSPIEIDGEEYYLKPMNCPHHHQVFKHQRLSYRQLPMRLAEFGTVHRYERSGVLTGLIRARSFTQNDAHIYCQKKDLGVEILNVLQLFKDIFDDIFLIKDYWFRLSLPDFKNGEKFGKIENRDMWDDAIRETRSALDQFNVEYVEGGGEAAFYGPKIDIQIRNVNQKEDTIATIQVDFYSASRFNLEFINKSGKKEQPVIIHRAIMGSFDRFLAFLIEQYDGNFPFWLSFKQVAILSMGENGNLYAAKIVEKLQEQGIRVFFDQSNKSSLGERIQASKKMRVPYVVVVGDKESAESVLSVNSRDNGKLGVLSEEEFFNLLKKEKQY